MMLSRRLWRQDVVQKLPQKLQTDLQFLCNLCQLCPRKSSAECFFPAQTLKLVEVL